MNALIRYFNNTLIGLVNEYKEAKNPVLENEGNQEKNVLWTCWLTGYDSMPEIVKLCYQRMTKMIPQDRVQVILITLDNYYNYIEIPRYIIKKYNAGIISAAHFSDVIRFCLLSKYGGMWLDSTVYVSEQIPEKYFEATFFTQKVGDINLYLNEPSRAQWCGFIWAGKKGNPLFEFIRDGLFRYWKKHNLVIDYIFFDYIIITAYKNVPYIKEMIDSQEPNNEKIWDLWQSINDPYDEERYKQICKNNIFHKLTYKGNILKQTANGAMTMYGYLLQEENLK